MTGIIWGLLGGIFIGVSDGVARVTTQRVSIAAIITCVMGLSSFLMTIWLGITSDWPMWEVKSWIVSGISGFLNLIALLFLYQAIARGPISLASPAASSFSVILVGINALAGHPFNFAQGTATLIVFVGICMLARPSDDLSENKIYTAKGLRITAYLGIAAGTAVALRFFFAQEAVQTLGAFHTLYLTRLAAFICAFALLLFHLTNVKYEEIFKGKIIYLIALQSLLETLAVGAFLIGSQEGDRIGAAIGFSAFPAVTALTAWIWLGETVTKNKIFWIGVIAVAVMIAILMSPS